MATAEDLRRIALSLEGTSEAPHFDRRAFKVRRTYATLAADGLTANINLTPDEQEFRCMLQPEAYRKISNKWGEAGWTTAVLAALSTEDIRAALIGPWQRASGSGRKRKSR
jgi:hypothetical protein